MSVFDPFADGSASVAAPASPPTPQTAPNEGFDPFASGAASAVAPTSDRPEQTDWKSLFSGVDNAKNFMSAPQRASIEQLAQTSNDHRNDTMMGLNMAYVKNRLPMLPMDVISGNWDAVKGAFAKNDLGIDASKLSDAQLYKAIGQKEQDLVVTQSQEFKDADTFGKLGMLGRLFAAHAGQVAGTEWDDANKPFVKLPGAPQMPDLPMLGMSNPALVAGVWNATKPLLEGVESRAGVITALALPGLKGAQKTLPLAKAALVGIQGLFTGLMAKATYDAAKAAPGVFKDPKSTFQDKVTSIGSIVGSGGLTILAGMHAAMDAMPEAKAGKLVTDLKGKTPEEAAQVLRQTASQQTELKPLVALHEAADNFEAITKDSLEGKLAEADKAFEKPGQPQAAESPKPAGPVTIQPLENNQYALLDEDGKVEQIASSADEARDAMEMKEEGSAPSLEGWEDEGHDEELSKSLAEPPAISPEDRQRMRKEELSQQDGKGEELLDWIKGKLPRPEDANSLKGELQGLYDNLTKEKQVDRAFNSKDANTAPRAGYRTTNTSAANAFFAKKGTGIYLDRLREQANDAGFHFDTPAEMLSAVDNSMRGNLMHANPMELDLSAPKGSLGTKRALSMHYGIIDPRMAKAMDFIKGIGSGVKNLWTEARSLPEFGQFKQILNAFNGEAQLRSMRLADDVRNVFNAVPDKLTRRAMYRAIEAGFDRTQLEDWAKQSTRGDSKRVFEAAAKLTPEQMKYAEKVKQWFEQKHPQAVQAGLLDPLQKRANYVPLMVDKAFGEGGPATWAGKLKGDFSHAIVRDFENSFELENAKDDQGDNLGLKLKSDDLPEVMAFYGAELDKVDLTRQALKELESKKALAKDGEPLVAPVHGFITKENADANSVISNPSSTTSESGVKYETLDHPAFKRFYFAGEDADGKPAMFKGEMGLHPEIYTHLKNILGRSGIANWMDSPGSAAAQLAKVSVKTFEQSQKFVKANMFSGSLFHATHIATRAAGNLVAPWELERVRPDNPKVIQSTRLGLQLGSDNAAMHEVMEGLGGGKDYNLLAKVPGIGKVVKGISDLTFHEVIPAYKQATWENLYAKNLKLFSDEIASGKATKDQVGYLTSHQVNARFGEQNWNDLGINPTWKHILSLTTLAPDFWRSNLQNFKEVAAGLTGAKAGREPLKAFAITAGVTWLAARVLNKAVSDDDSYHFEDPFKVHMGSRTYSFRTEVQDVQEMATKPASYMMGRLAPFASSALEYLVGANWRGEKVDAGDILKETAGKAIPAAIKWLPGPEQADEWATGRRATTSHFEQFLTSQGIKVGRSSPLTDAYELAAKYKEKIGHAEKGGVYPTSKYQQLRYALEDGDTAKAKDELAKLEEGGKSFNDLARGFKTSVNHPWTGSHQSDVEFKKSLSPEDLAKVEKAEAHRAKIMDAFKHLSQ